MLESHHSAPTVESEERYVELFQEQLRALRYYFRLVVTGDGVRGTALEGIPARYPSHKAKLASKLNEIVGDLASQKVKKIIREQCFEPLLDLVVELIVVLRIPPDQRVLILDGMPADETGSSLLWSEYMSLESHCDDAQHAAYTTHPRPLA
ncbi:unnamed protein product [Periconia digitata]|uniref:Uncharacterized protein n=1 Tax=Periconia digitata TaxID=1303443 RepID=A0A9W4XQE2_9PLEO|nr:unnamed protein product [Periconia digitata]